MIDVYIEPFNIIFDTEIIPDSWLVGYIKLIYKNKGDKFFLFLFKYFKKGMYNKQVIYCWITFSETRLVLA
jgi:hypothetical protein